MNDRRLISSGSTFEEQMAYSRAVVGGGPDHGVGNDRVRLLDDDDRRVVAEQAEQTFRNIAAALAEAGSSLADVVRVVYVLPDASEFEQAWPAMRAAFADVRPAAMMIQAGLADPRMRIEIEVTAVRRTPVAR